MSHSAWTILGGSHRLESLNATLCFLIIPRKDSGLVRSVSLGLGSRSQNLRLCSPSTPDAVIASCLPFASAPQAPLRASFRQLAITAVGLNRFALVSPQLQLSTILESFDSEIRDQTTKRKLFSVSRRGRLVVLTIRRNSHWRRTALLFQRHLVYAFPPHCEAGVRQGLDENRAAQGTAKPTHRPSA